ncbi:TRAP transporter large permease [Sunxiuqinia elliptica]|uniref:Tripartite ATP-independent transporter DctM subunit n=1 Tax=Sunxiuqinia elliptica TaxID=655355 RepID=A0A4R6GU73_9BACT|nr:TRAP transporter large permease [Sunxiuqinia elliptica]TDN98234.1 tripartite ATP-independent transporter DctM subunit [Sunxiuqinia elliptica]TDO60341.1 tripartite ATP-independent transporter DctM subunit [Sunxiuqinia elliptica]
MEFLEIFVLIFSFIVLLVIGVPIAFSIGISGILTMLVSIDVIPALTTFSQRMATGLDSFALLAIPFFILAGNIMNSGGIAIRLIDFARVLVGGIPGGVAIVNVLANMLFGAISGSAAASASAIGSIMGPEMKKEGYPDNFSAAVNITSATTGLSIPPSNILIVYSLASGGVSITALFLAGYVPGILTGLAIITTAVTMLIYKQKGFQAAVKGLGVAVLVAIGLVLAFQGVSFARESFSPVVNQGLSGVALAAFAVFAFIKTKNNKEKALAGTKKLLDAIPSLLMLIIVIGGIVAGYFTATEASAIAVLYSLILAFIYRQITIADLPTILLRSVKTTGIVLLLVATCLGLSWIMAYENIPQNVSEGLLTISSNPFIILLLINLILLFVGIFMDMTPAVLIFTPIFLPIVTAMGVDPIHFGIIMVLNLSVGLCTPPVGSVLFIGCSVSGLSIDKVIKPLIPMFLAMVVVLLLVTYLPELSLWLPSKFGF